MLKIHLDVQFHFHIFKDKFPVFKNLKAIASTPSRRLSLTDYTALQVARARREGRYSTADNYSTALRSLLAFHEGEDLLLQDITPVLITEYERWLKSRRISMNTLSCYLRSLRSLYNKAVEEKLIEDLQPFSRSYTGYPRTEKRSISHDEIRLLKDIQLPEGSTLELSRDLFLFGIYACGMPFVDIAFLRKDQISADGYLTYRRRKTNQEVRMKLLPCALDIISRYHSEATDYIFPLLTKTDTEEAYRQYREKLCYYNRQLKELARMSGIKHRLTSYVSRHSWASLAYEQNTEVSVISKGLGHTTSRTTQIYIKGIDDTRLDEANQRIAASIFEKDLHI